MKNKERQAKYDAFVKYYTDASRPDLYGNASACAREVGYSPKSSSIQGHTLVTKLKDQIAIARGRSLDVDRKNFFKDKEAMIRKIADDIEALPSTHTNKPKMYDLLSKLRSFYDDKTKIETVLTVKHADELNNIAVAIAQRITQRGS